VRTLKYGGLIH